MEELYRDSLRTTRQQKPEDMKLFSSNWSYKGGGINFKTEEKLPAAEPVKVEAEQATEVTYVTEKIKTLDSLDIFDKGIDEESATSLSGEKNSVKQKQHLVDKITIDELANSYTDLLAEKPLESGLDVLFVTDESRIKPELEEGNTPHLFQYYFEPNVALLFHRMTQAMQLKEDKIMISALQVGGEDFKNELLNHIYISKPKLVMSLGASSYQFLSQSDSRLKEVHGQLLELNLNCDDQVFNTKLMPIFSPKLLQTAPNMKKTAWLDMQKAMEYLK